MSLVALEPRASAQGQETHGVYHTQFENDWVRLVRVRYPANSKVPLHGHPPSVTAYVYLSESSPVRFTHQGTRTHVVTRQPTTPGGFRVSRGGDETHTAENLGPIASDFLRVEFKTDPAGASSPFYRDRGPLGPAAKTTTDVRFTNAQMRITRVAIPAGQTAEIATTATAPALLIALGEATMTADGAALPLKVGQERWVAASRKEQLANTGKSQVELLRIDVLTAPDSSRRSRRRLARTDGAAARCSPGTGPSLRPRKISIQSSRPPGGASARLQARQAVRPPT